VSRAYAWASDLLSVGVALKFGGEGGGLIRITTPAGAIVLWRNAENGQLYCMGAAGSAIPVTNNWYFIELVIDRLANTVKVYINSKLDIDQPLGFNLAAVTSITLELCPYDVSPVDGTTGNVSPATTTTMTINYDHLYINSGEKLGTMAIKTRFPTSELQAQWGNSTAFEGGENLANWQVAASQPTYDPLKRFLFASEVDTEDRYESNHDVADRPVIAANLGAVIRKTVSQPMSVYLTFDTQQVAVDDIYTTFKMFSRPVDVSIYNKQTIEQSQFGLKVK
jgi:hypothetical protein